MKDLLDQAVGDGALVDLGQRFGLDADVTRNLVGQLAPAIAGGARRKAQQEGGMTALLESLRGENEARYVEHPAEAAGGDGTAAGAAFLKNLLGADEAPQQMAVAAAGRTGAADAAVQFLPALAAVVQGVLQRNAPDAEIGAMESRLAGGGDRAGAGLGDLLAAFGGGGSSGGGLGGLVGGVLAGALGGGGGGAAPGGQLGGLLAMLDQDGDGSPLDDILDAVMR